MNPGVDAHRTGVLPQARAVSVSVRRTASLLAAPATTSTRGSTGAGLKKCRPATRAGSTRPSAISVTDSDDVFVVRIARSPHVFSSSAKSSRLTARSSTAASTTSPHPARSAMEPTVANRAPAWSAAPVVRLPFAASCASRCRMPATDGVQDSYRVTRHGRHLSDAGAHSAGADDADRDCTIERCHAATLPRSPAGPDSGREDRCAGRSGGPGPLGLHNDLHDPGGSTLPDPLVRPRATGTWGGYDTLGPELWPRVISVRGRAGG